MKVPGRKNMERRLLRLENEMRLTFGLNPCALRSVPQDPSHSLVNCFSANSNAPSKEEHECDRSSSDSQARSTVAMPLFPEQHCSAAALLLQCFFIRALRHAQTAEAKPCPSRGLALQSRSQSPTASLAQASLAARYMVLSGANEK